MFYLINVLTGTGILIDFIKTFIELKETLVIDISLVKVEAFYWQCSIELYI